MKADESTAESVKNAAAALRERATMQRPRRGNRERKARAGRKQKANPKESRKPRPNARKKSNTRIFRVAAVIQTAAFSFTGASTQHHEVAFQNGQSHGWFVDQPLLFEAGR